MERTLANFCEIVYTKYNILNEYEGKKESIKKARNFVENELRNAPLWTYTHQETRLACGKYRDKICRMHRRKGLRSVIYYA